MLVLVIDKSLEHFVPVEGGRLLDLSDAVQLLSFAVQRRILDLLDIPDFL